MNTLERWEILRTIIIGVVILIFLGPMIALGHGLMSFVYRAAGYPTELWTHIFSGIAGVLLGVLFLAALHWVFHKFSKKGRITHKRGRALYYSVIEVMESIARGDFDVMIEDGEYGPFGEIVDSINKMALELGTMENLRQDFISNVSHEMQSPLTSIRGFAALLKNDDISTEQKNHYIEIIETESHRLSSLSDNLLKLSSLESGREQTSKSEYRLDRQIENVALMLEPQWMEKELNVEAELERVTLRADENLMLEVWINLLHNAVKFTQPGGTIKIILREEDGEICCRISDTGVGIAPQDQMRIFERFYKADKARSRSLGGNGLGLSIVKEIVRMHDGRIEVESEPQKGTTFRVCLPRLNLI
ncbi:MAG: HAMP domain-containing histidine kinase [Synergistaceae bacterium]|jgi:signal transduction histidine kinase|nr:HAMP domain-containing histidine kinase [Synergistaceae bacterium]